MLRVGEKVFPRKELTSWLLSTKWSALKTCKEHYTVFPSIVPSSLAVLDIPRPWTCETTILSLRFLFDPNLAVHFE